jgi:hypothetical protein
MYVLDFVFEAKKSGHIYFGTNKKTWSYFPKSLFHNEINFDQKTTFQHKTKP